jgi:LacI family transcriptional regulator
MTTLSDVARLAGVGRSTASYVINRTGLHKVGPETQARILAAAAELNYRPSIAGRALAKGKTFMAGALFPSVSGSFTPEILQGLEDALNEASYSLILCTYRNAGEFREKSLVLSSKQIDGAIIFPAVQDFEIELCRQLSRQMPLVYITRASNIDGVPHVRVDGEMINYLAVRHLLERGHRRIAVQEGGDPQRLRGLKRAVSEFSGVQCIILPSGGSEKDILDAGLRHPDKPTAYLLYGDLTAARLIGTALDHGLNVPGDLSIMGSNGEIYGELSRPALTTVSQPRYEQGYEAGRLLLRQIKGEPSDNIILKPALIERASVKTIG